MAWRWLNLLNPWSRSQRGCAISQHGAVCKVCISKATLTAHVFWLRWDIQQSAVIKRKPDLSC
jgi:hypothetical protein